MALPHTFANVTELDTPQLDDNFNALGAITVIPCVASGTNALTLTPAANTPTISAYSNNAPEFSFEAASTSTGPLTLQVLGLGLKNVYKNNGATAAGANDFLSSSTYKVTYNSALNSGAGGWVILNQGASSSSAGAVQGAFSGLKIQVTSNTQLTVTAKQIAVSDGSTNFTTLFNPNFSIVDSVVGAGGIDTGSISSSTWYYVFAIYNTNTLTAAGLISLSATAPTLPSGYVQFARIGAIITDGSANIIRTLQYNKTSRYIIGTNPTTAIIIASGVAGTFSITSPTLASASVAAVVPPTASQILIGVNAQWKNTGASVMVAPNTSWGGTNNGPQGSNGGTYPYSQTNVGSGNFLGTSSVLIPLEATSIAWVSSSGGGAISCFGWEDNL